MRRAKLLVFLALAFAALLTPGCMTSSTGTLPPGAVPRTSTGVVEIFRNDPFPRLVGYVCVDESDPTLQHWLLNGDEVAPVLPVDEIYEVEYIPGDPNPMNGQMLCETYGSTLLDPKIWRTFREGPEDCVGK